MLDILPENSKGSQNYWVLSGIQGLHALLLIYYIKMMHTLNNFSPSKPFKQVSSP